MKVYKNRTKAGTARYKAKARLDYYKKKGYTPEQIKDLISKHEQKVLQGNCIIEGEIWKEIKDWEEYYQISNLGRVRTKRYEKILIHHFDGAGYPMVGFQVKGRRYKAAKIHRLIALAFIPNPENKPEVNHKDGVKTNYSIDNLEWVTNAENQKHAIRTGLRRPEKAKDTKLTWDQVDTIREKYNCGYRLIDLANEYGVKDCTIYKIVKHISWKNYVEA